ncbi:hypothetical protein P618_200085 [Holospora obtusa F1]|uniref:Uncharacterized protein n=1 Tax=Holospora obtusa F1 TaxID=1399147 RepID=W6TFD3_HOLOB|nr:hypothetical protein [Holospora obtusa]ETZ07716.1 hypothetical protein P618_200085 [Holospora obtusa F1]
MKKIQESEVSVHIQAVEFDEMRHFFQKKVKNSGLSKPLIIAHAELLPRLQGIVMLQHSHNFTKKSNI